jgi:precorrin-6B methylase 2
MNKEELLSAIAKTNKVIGNDTMPEAVKEVARNTKAKLEAQLAELEKGEAPESKKEEPKKGRT